MANNKLILRSVISPWVSPFNDITTGSVLSWADVDNNFIYLKGELIHSGYTSNNQLVLQKINGNTINIDLAPFTDDGNRWYIPSDVIVEIPSDYQSFIYGDLYVEGLLKLNDNSQLVVLNGDIILNGGSISGNGTTLSVDLPIFDTKTVSGSYNDGLLTLVNNSGGTVSVNGFNSLYGNYWHIPVGDVVEVDEDHQMFIYGDLYVEGLLKLNDNSQLVTLNGDIILSGGSISGNGTTLSVDLPMVDTKIVSGSYNGNTGILTLTNNTGGTFNVSGFYTGSTEIFVTGGTYSNGVATFTNNTGGTFNVSGFYTGSTEIFVTGGTYNMSNGAATFTNNTGGTFSVSGFYTGSTEVFVTGGTYSNGVTTFTNNTGGTFNVVSTTTYSAGVISGSTNWSATGTGQINLPNLKVALYDNPNNYEPILIYDVQSGISGSGGINALIDNDTNYVVINYNNGNPIYQVLNNPGTINNSDIILYLIVYRLNNFIHVLEFGDDGAGLPNKLNNRLLSTERFARESGLSLGLSASTGVVLISSGIAWNGTNKQSLVGVNSQDDIFFQNYHSGGTWVYTTTADTINNSFYDDGTDKVSGTSGNYLVNWYFRGQEINDHIYEVWGNDEYVSVLDAEASSEPTLPELITSHAFLVGRIIIGVGETTGITQTAFGTVFQPSGYASGFHNDLLNIQGGAPGEYYHLSSNEYNNLALTNINNNFTSNQTINGSLTAITISATTFYGDGSNLSGISTDNFYTTGATLIGNTIEFDRNDLSNAYSINLAPILNTSTFTGNTIYDESKLTTFNGEILKCGLGTTISGMVYYLNSSNNWVLTNANSVVSSDGLLGIAVGTNPSVDGMLIKGLAKNVSYTGTTSSPLYLSTTNGVITEYPPSGTGFIIRIIGYKLGTSGSILFNPDPTWIEL